MEIRDLVGVSSINLMDYAANISKVQEECTKSMTKAFTLNRKWAKDKTSEAIRP